MRFKVNGFIKKVGPIITGKADFKKREIWLLIPDGKYSQTVSIEFTKNMVDRLDEFELEDDVIIDCSLRGNIWTSPQGVDKCLTHIHGININPAPKANPETMVTQEQITTGQYQPIYNQPPSSDDDLPF